MMDADEKIYYLNIANQTFLPTTVFCLKFLRELYVRGTSFYEFALDNDSVPGIPSEIERLAPSLKKFSVYDTTVGHLPEQIGKLTSLIRLELFNTGLVAIPDSIDNLSLLEQLYLSNNNLTSLPTTMANLQSLTNVYLNNNPRLRSVQSLNGLPNLRALYTSYCPIERLPLNLPDLNSLTMYTNNLTDLIGIGTLGNSTTFTKIFNFNMNRIRFVPPQIRHVRNLYSLYLDDNELTTLPTEIFNITTLRFLLIRNNFFSVPELTAIVAKFNTTNPSLTLYW
jgi:Leucine-rich repeat (LRR) protein